MTTTYRDEIINGRVERVIDKDPQEVLVYTVDWDTDDWLGTDALASSQFTVDTGLTKDAENFSSPNALVQLSGGTLGQRYRVTNKVTTVTSGETGVRSFIVNVVRR